MDRTILATWSLYTLGLRCSSKSLVPSTLWTSLRTCQRSIQSRPPLLASNMTDTTKFRATVDKINPFLRKMRYAVRGSLPKEAKRIESAIRKGEETYPFKKVLFCNIGDCHAMGQKPLTFVRQLLAACSNPGNLLGRGIYPSDVEDRARLILDHCNGNSIGSYSESRGIKIVRQHVAEFISKRDGIPCSYHNIYLLNGASDGIKSMLYTMMGSSDTGIMIPVPQYPLYTAAIAELNAQPISYELDEDNNWALNIESLRNSVREARNTCEPRVMVVINPGNPTGQNLPKENMQEIIEFCHDEGLVLFTDEVYQENVYMKGEKFRSFRKVLLNMGVKYSDFQMITFNSTSKGFFGECGIRGGYMNLIGMDDAVMDQIYKHFSISLCPNTPGQVVTDALVKRPENGDPSYDLYMEEHDRVLQELARKAQMVYTRMNRIPGVHCNEVQGAMYAFPKIDIPEEALEDAKKMDPDMELDKYYCFEFLRQKGVCVIPGSGFGQKEGTYHFRTTILPGEADLIDMLDRFEEFHCNFLRKYGKL